MSDLSFQLLPWEEKYLPHLIHHANHWAIARWMTDAFPHPYTEEKGLRFIQMAQTNSQAFIRAIVMKDEAIGGIGLHFQTDINRLNAELGYWLSPDYQGKGIMSKAIGEMVRTGFEHYDLVRIFARPFGTNIPSQRALEKSGFQLEARFHQNLIKNGERMDELIYAIYKT